MIDDYVLLDLLDEIDQYVSLAIQMFCCTHRAPFAKEDDDGDDLFDDDDDDDDYDGDGDGDGMLYFLAHTAHAHFAEIFGTAIRLTTMIY